MLRGARVDDPGSVVQRVRPRARLVVLDGWVKKRTSVPAGIMARIRRLQAGAERALRNEIKTMVRVAEVLDSNLKLVSEPRVPLRSGA